MKTKIKKLWPKIHQNNQCFENNENYHTGVLLHAWNS